MVTGLDVAEKIRASGVGRKMFLTTPFIDQAFALRTGRLRSEPGRECKGDFSTDI
jgi:hypothetical protein